MKKLLLGLTLLASTLSFAGWDAKTDLMQDGHLLSEREFTEFAQAVKDNRLMFRGQDVLKDFCFISNKFARKEAKQKCVAYAVENDLDASDCTELVIFTDGAGDFCTSTSYFIID